MSIQEHFKVNCECEITLCVLTKKKKKKQKNQVKHLFTNAHNKDIE